MIYVDARAFQTLKKTGKDIYAVSMIKELLALRRSDLILLFHDDADIPDYLLVYNYKVFKSGFLWHLQVRSYLASIDSPYFLTFNSYLTPSMLTKNVKTFFMVHDLITFLFKTESNKKALFIERVTLRKALKKAYMIGVVSCQTKEDLFKVFKKASEKTILTLPPAVRSSLLQNVDLSNITFKLPKKYILSVATLEPRKNLITLIRAFKLISEDYPDLKLILVGKKGWQYDNILKEVETCKHKIIVTGHLNEDDLKLSYKNAEAFVFPSLYEGFGMPPLEALTLGCPVIASSAVKEAVGEAGIYLKNPKDIVELSQKLRLVLEDPNVKDLLQLKAENQKFSWKANIDLLMDALGLA